MEEHETIRIEYMPMDIGETMAIYMTVSDWLQLLGQYELIGESLSNTQRKLGLKIWDAVTTEAYRKAATAHIAEHQEKLPPQLLKLMRMTGQVPPDADDDTFDPS